ncbi:ATP-binding cassette domain-containing protein [Rhodovastum atsumiense]|uniref:ATP-binding cassette domain-containing protein n=1 Tax=Rhodovastum atsumiense TaxID=504468 RepID=A0A5M6IP81_9PROT|nr:ATP-binding cassette domain-containing protein [Rhodovastum atsumiense]KAA5609265.1 ATP-binding cassette domain-containing protein [Rhodovastum atsumiense]CAH2601721.1 ATP-binding cassette domain-containing protein [Rhodovastum atsumiense]
MTGAATMTVDTDFLRRHGLPVPAAACSLQDYWQSLPWEVRDGGGWTLAALQEQLRAFLAARPAGGGITLECLEVTQGCDKDGQPEAVPLCLRPGEVVAIVGPTGSGKSRLLADIECLAQGDTPSRRVVRVNGATPAPRMRVSAEARLVAQISQNMNFVLDLHVEDFLSLHAESCGVADPRAAARTVLDAAIAMAGEPFTAATPLTQLSGGQSRALMIADAALLSAKPVVLIDEIENAGVDRRQALRLFTSRGKIVLLSTHDPLLALSGARRVIIRNGGIAAVVATSPEEQALQAELQAHDHRLARLRDAVRRGETLLPAWQQT